MISNTKIKVDSVKTSKETRHIANAISNNLTKSLKNIISISHPKISVPATNHSTPKQAINDKNATDIQKVTVKNNPTIPITSLRKYSIMAIIA